VPATGHAGPALQRHLQHVEIATFARIDLDLGAVAQHIDAQLAQRHLVVADLQRLATATHRQAVGRKRLSDPFARLVGRARAEEGEAIEQLSGGVWHGRNPWQGRC